MSRKFQYQPVAELHEDDEEEEKAEPASAKASRMDRMEAKLLGQTTQD